MLGKTKIATPISRLFDNESAAKKIIGASDYLECRDCCYSAKYPGQRLFHFDMNIARKWDEKIETYLNSIALLKNELKLITFHLDSSYESPVIRDGMYQPGGVQYSVKELIDNSRDNVAWLRKTFGKDISIAIENNNYYNTPAYDYVTDGDVLSQLVKGNGIKFLFDISHAKITAHNKGISYGKYKESLPLNEVIQIHVSRHGINDKNTAFDMHEIPDESLTNEVIEMIKNYKIGYVTIEYYKNLDILVEYLKKLKN